MAEAASGEDWKAGGFGLYIHWPFCAAKCPYCDFNSHVAAQIDHTRWERAYIEELRRSAASTGDRVLQSVFFGGGTPSLMDPDSVGRILEEVRRLWPMANDPEITLEANPTSVEASRFRAFRDAGVSRVSMGFQSLRDESLRRLGRMHTAAEARAAFDVARSHFDRVSFDLIYARQDQSLDDWTEELAEALTFAADHLSLYQLTIEPGTAFGDRHARGGLRGLPGEDLSADLYQRTQEICDAAGLSAYEVSNHANPDAESRHNLIYWRGGDYVGIGPGAHGRVSIGGKRFATETHLAPTVWLNAVEKAGTGESQTQALSPEEHAEEYLMMSLRLREGTDLSRLERLGMALDNAALDHLAGLDLISVSGNRLRATDAGRPVLNGILRNLILH